MKLAKTFQRIMREKFDRGFMFDKLEFNLVQRWIEQSRQETSIGKLF